MGQTSMINQPLAHTVRGAAVDATPTRSSSADPCTVTSYMGAIRVHDMLERANDDEGVAPKPRPLWAQRQHTRADTFPASGAVSVA
jgi:hypothetical protein